MLRFLDKWRYARILHVFCINPIYGDLHAGLQWATDLRGHKRHVLHLIRGGRARWKIENEPFNTLKNQSYNFEHTYGHGEQHLSVVFAVLMILAFLVDQAQQLCCALFQAVWAKLGRKRMLWERLRALLYDYAFASMRQLFEALLDGFKKSSPLVMFDSSSSFPLLLRLRAIEPEVLSSRGAIRPAGRENSAFDKTACHVASRKSLPKTRQGRVELLAELSTTLGA